MSEPFIGEIQIFGFDFNPRGWAFCNGALLPLSQNTALFALIGTQFGGNGQTSFGLPNLSARAVMGAGTGAGLSQWSVGDTVGEASVTLTASEMPVHRHVVRAVTAAGAEASPEFNVPAGSEDQLLYGAASGPGSSAVAMEPLAPGGNGLPHTNQQPYLGMNFCIALQGIFPQFP